MAIETSVVFPYAHSDGFVRDHLPLAHRWPVLRLDQPGLSYPVQLNCAVELLDAQVNRGHGDRVALRTQESTWTYRELLLRANGVARILRDKLGLIPGNRVLLRGWNHPMLAACWLGVIKAGGVAVTSMPLLRARELVQMIEKARVGFVLCDAHLRDPLDLACSAVQHSPHVLYFNDAGDGDAHLSLDALLDALPPEALASFDNVATRADEPALIAFTSGTTGTPKASVHFHRDVLAACDAFPGAMLAPQPDDIFCGTSPLAFTYGLGGLLCFPLRYGASCLLIEHPDIETVLQAIEHHGVTILFSVPTFWRQMTPMAHEYDLSSLRCCVSAGEPLPDVTRRHWREATGKEMIDGLGTTELLHIFISHAPDQARRGAVGYVVPGYELCIMDAHGRPLPPDTLGRLAVRGPTGCRYLDDARQQDYVIDGWNLTGDVGAIDVDGYFYYHARSDDMIVTSGYNVAGTEVEEVLMQHPAVLECAVVGVPDEMRGQLIKAFVVPKSGVQSDESLSMALQDFVKQQAAPYKYPRRIEFVGALPRTESGKLQRYKLR